MSTISSAHRQRVAKALGTSIELIPSDTDALVDLLGPMLADYTRTRDTMIADCGALSVPTSDADGPLSLCQMAEAVANRRRKHAHELDNVHLSLHFAGYPELPGETHSERVCRALRDIGKADPAAADDSSDLAETCSRLTAAGYIPAPGETTGDLVARALRDTREADDRREEAERDISDIRDQLRAAQEHARDLAAQLGSAASMILHMSATISRLA